MARIKIILLIVFAIWFYQGLSWSALVEMKEYLTALGIAMVLLPWVEYHIDG